MILLSTSLVLASLYLYWMASVLQGWYRYVATVPASLDAFQGISIVIPFKDEAINLPSLLKSLDELDYDIQKYEVLFINDASNDGGAHLISTWIKQSDISATLLNSESPGKKAAQELGVLKARYDLIACTDADCIVPKKWLQRINEAFSNEDTKLAFGPVKFSSRGKNLQKLEFNALISSTMGMLGLGWSIMGNGANMAFRKHAYLEVTERLKQMNTPSGDDVFLLHELAKMGKQPQFLVGRDSMVKTRPQSTFNALLNQRIRWASKAKYYRNRATILIGSLVLATNLLLLVLLIASAFWPHSIIAFAILLVVKAITDFILLKSHASYFNVPFRMGYFLLQELLNIVYVPTVAMLSQLKSYSWKGRRY